jgi:hypothetical protein
MRINPKLEPYRVHFGFYGTPANTPYGAFVIPSEDGKEEMKIIASSGEEDPGIPWDHVSVSFKHRTPRWSEMCMVKDWFWDPEETVMQLHPPKSTWINNHPNCLHLWKPINAAIPLPPSDTVGYKELNRVAGGRGLDAGPLRGQPLKGLPDAS